MSTRRRIAIIAAAAAAVVVLAFTISNAADDDSTETTTTDETDAPADRAERTNVARIIAAYVAPHELVIEPAELLVGDAAAEAAEAAGDEILDFYVVDHPEGRTTLPVATDVHVTVVDCSAACEEGAPGDYDTLTTTVEATSLYRLTIADGVVVGIDEVYLP